VTQTLTIEDLLDDLKSKGSEKTRKTYIRHGMQPDRTLGVSVADLKSIAKTIKGQQEVAFQLYETGIMDAMYLAGLVVDGSKMTRSRLQAWAEAAEGMPMISEYIVPWTTVESTDPDSLAADWIQSKQEHVASSGWCTYSGLVAIREDGALDFERVEELLRIVVQEIGGANNRVRYTMNGFVISVGAYVKPLLHSAQAAAKEIGAVSVPMGDTACKVPLATAYIAKIEEAGRVGQKRRTIRC
jgi:hypothetical protein